MTHLAPFRAAGLSIAIALSLGACGETSQVHPSGNTDAALSPMDAAAPADGADLGSAPDAAQVAAWDPFRTNCLAQINAYRAKVGSAPLKLWTPQANACADQQSHKGGDDFNASGKVTFHKYFGQCAEQYQNECWYSSSVATDMITWCNDAFFAEGPPPQGQLNHYSVMVNPKATAVACGLYPMPAPNGGWWMTQDYIE